ncbi:MAG: hypothetical protein ABIP10_13495 [Ferruginibacter sp.]
MRSPLINQFSTIFVGTIFATLFACNMKKQTKDTSETKEQQLHKIDSLLQDAAYAESMASTLNAAYYKGIGEAVPQFISATEETDTIKVSKKEDRIATNLAGFYALECGVELLSDESKETPIIWLQRIAAQSLDSTSNLLLNRFANATWKAGQPFRAIERIKRSSFIGASHLSDEEVAKDEVQIKNAAVKLLFSMQDVLEAPTEEQMKYLKILMQDTSYAKDMAAWMDASYYAGMNEQAPPFLIKEDDTATLTKKVKSIKIATSIAGFYGLECGLNYLVTITGKLPSEILQAIIDGELSAENEQLLSRFANATWKAGQPFIGLSRITREIFTPFYFLSESDRKKDLMQVKAAAEKLLKDL